MTAAAQHHRTTAASLGAAVAARVAAGERFAGLFCTALPGSPTGGLLLSAHLAGANDVGTVDALLPADARTYPAVTPLVGAAFWYERELHDLFGIAAEGHPRLAPLVLPSADGEAQAPRPGAASTPEGPHPGGRGAAPTGTHSLTSTSCRGT